MLSLLLLSLALERICARGEQCASDAPYVTERGPCALRLTLALRTCCCTTALTISKHQSGRLIIVCNQPMSKPDSSRPGGSWDRPMRLRVRAAPSEMRGVEPSANILSQAEAGLPAPDEPGPLPVAPVLPIRTTGDALDELQPCNNLPIVFSNDQNGIWQTSEVWFPPDSPSQLAFEVLRSAARSTHCLEAPAVCGR